MLRKNAIAAAAMGMLLSSCGAELSQTPMRTADDDAATASRDYVNCLSSAAAKTDDGKSDLHTVALQVAAQCATQYASLKAAFDQRLAGDARQSFDADMDDKQLSVVGEVVQRRRGSSPVTAQQ